MYEFSWVVILLTALYFVTFEYNKIPCENQLKLLKILLNDVHVKLFKHFIQANVLILRKNKMLYVV